MTIHDELDAVKKKLKLAQKRIVAFQHQEGITLKELHTVKEQLAYLNKKHSAQSRIISVIIAAGFISKALVNEIGSIIKVVDEGGKSL